jgi:DNA polymerase-3 subunit alpha/error-prone DNA polymerase
MVNFKPENRMPSLLDTPVKEYKLPTLARSEFEDAFDEIELLSFPVSCSPFGLLQTEYRGGVRANELTSYHKRTVKMLAYLVSRKHVPTKRGEMFFGTLIDLDGNYFDTAHFSDCLKQYPFQGGGCYLLLGTEEVDYHFPTITIQKMAKMPFIPDLRYSHSDKRFDAQKNIREDVSMTHRAPYPQEHEIGLPRHRL